MSEPPPKNDDIRDELKRAEERVAEIRRTNTRLEQRLLQDTTVRNRAIAGALLAVLSATVGAALAITGATLESASASKEHLRWMERERAIIEECRAEREKSQHLLIDCEREATRLGPPGWRFDRPSTTTPRPCNCQPGDPLCSCL